VFNLNLLALMASVRRKGAQTGYSNILELIFADSDVVKLAYPIRRRLVSRKAESHSFVSYWQRDSLASPIIQVHASSNCPLNIWRADITWLVKSSASRLIFGCWLALRVITSRSVSIPSTNPTFVQNRNLFKYICYTALWGNSVIGSRLCHSFGDSARYALK